jgi:hypothetical protein
VDNRSDAREFLCSRRARITPAMAGLPTYGGRRRVAGLRREEVALLAGVSVDYYTRLERGNLSGVSDNVLEALARALQLDEAERARRRGRCARCGGACNGCWTRSPPHRHLCATRGWTSWPPTGLGTRCIPSCSPIRVRPVNNARFVFLDPRAQAFCADVDRGADEVVAILRTEAGRNPHDRDLPDLIGELSTRSETFHVRWASHNVRFNRTGIKRIPV